MPMALASLQRNPVSRAVMALPRRHAHAGAEKQQERGERDAGRRVGRPEPEGRGAAQREGRDDARMADQHRRSGAMLEQLRIELEPHQEHEQDEPDLAQHLQVVERATGEQQRRRRRQHPAEKRGPESDAGDDLGDDQRLLHPAQRSSEQSGGDEHHANLE
jgi:hypothetical protein